MNVEGLDCTLGLDIVTELVVSRTGFNPDDIFVARACPGCARQPADVSILDLAGRDGFKVTVSGPSRVPVHLWGTELLYCKCDRCGSIYTIVVFGPCVRGDEVLTEYMIVRQDRFLVRIVRELEALVREGHVPGNVNEWISSRLVEAVDSALARIDDRLWLVDQDWQESRYRKTWIL